MKQKKKKERQKKEKLRLKFIEDVGSQIKLQSLLDLVEEVIVNSSWDQNKPQWLRLELVVAPIWGREMAEGTESMHVSCLILMVTLFQPRTYSSKHSLVFPRLHLV